MHACVDCGKWRNAIAEWDLTDFVNTCATFGWRLAVGGWRLAFGV